MNSRISGRGSSKDGTLPGDVSLVCLSQPWGPVQSVPGFPLGLAQLVTLGDTLQSWSEEIVRMWRFTRSNGITEGFHNKMETISRQAYGFRNFENYRQRVQVLCS